MKKLILKLTVISFALTLLVIASCKKEDPIVENPGNEPPITLTCSDFTDNVTLINNPNASVDYIIDCNVSINKELEINPGTVIRFTSGAGIEVNNSGIIHAVGTENSRITMEGQNGVAGDWLGVFMNSDNNANIMEYVDILDAGSGTQSSDDLASIILWVDARLTLNNCKIENGDANGINVYYRTTFINSNNIITKCKQPVRIMFTDVAQLSTTNTYTGNTNDYIEVGAREADVEDVVLEDLGVPYFFSDYRQGVVRFTVDDNASLIIKPGVTIYFDQGAHLYIDSYISAVGTAAKPIRFLGKSATVGYWEGIRIHSNSPLSTIEHVSIMHAGSDEVYDNTIASISMWYDHYLNLSNTTFEDCGGTVAVNRGSTIGTNTFIENDNTYNGLLLREF